MWDVMIDDVFLVLVPDTNLPLLRKSSRDLMRKHPKAECCNTGILKTTITVLYGIDSNDISQKIIR